MPVFDCSAFHELDKGLIEDYRTTVNDAQEEIEACVQSLNYNSNEEDIHRLFRAMHSLKGNCRMVSLDALVDLLHELEEIVGDMRLRYYGYSPGLGEFLLEIVESTRELIRQVIEQGNGDEDLRQYLAGLISSVRGASEDQREAVCQSAVAELRGDVRTASHSAKVLPELPPDLVLMKELAGQLDNLSIYRKDRSEEVKRLCDHLNQAMNQPVDPQQLAAAVYLHDMGMALVPASIVQKEGALEREGLRQIQLHVHVGAQLLQRFGDWDEAATIVLQHHERIDGTGYPNRLKGDQIHLGARMLSVADSFCAMTNERQDRSYRKTLFSAVREINAEGGAQFDPEVVEAFNDVIRRHYLTAQGG